MENKKILKIVGLLTLGGIIIGFTINPIIKFISNSSNSNSGNKKDSSNKMSQQEANILALEYTKLYANAKQRDGGFNNFTIVEPNKIINKLKDNGYILHSDSKDIYTATPLSNYQLVKK